MNPSSLVAWTPCPIIYVPPTNFRWLSRTNGTLRMTVPECGASFCASRAISVSRRKRMNSQLCFSLDSGFVLAGGVGKQHSLSNAARCTKGLLGLACSKHWHKVSTCVDGTCRAHPVFVQGSPAPSPLAPSESSTARTLSIPVGLLSKFATKDGRKRAGGCQGFISTLVIHHENKSRPEIISAYNRKKLPLPPHVSYTFLDC